MSDGRIAVKAATGGVAVALDALMRERGGVWIAHGAGSADRLVVDATDKVRVPPEQSVVRAAPAVARGADFSAYYGGFANEGLWPLCHVVDVRPQFRSDDWAAYQDINARFAAAIDAEIGASDAPVFIQDYHLALVAPASGHCGPTPHRALLAHPVAVPGSPSHLSVAARDWSAGLLANDLIAFQLERDRRNFLMAAEEELHAEVELESSRVRFGGRSSTVVSVPIGVDYDRIQQFAADPALPDGTAASARAARPARRHHRPRRRSPRLHKGIPERLERARRAHGAATGAARTADIRPDWRPVALRISTATPRSSAN